MNEENKKLAEEVGRHFDAKSEEIKRHIDVMLENVRSDFKIFGEQLADVSEDVAMLKEDMDYVKTEIVEIKK